TGDNEGSLGALVYSNNPCHLGKAAVSIGLLGKEDGLLRLTIPLATPEKGGCSGSASFGPLIEVVAELGHQLDPVVILADQPTVVFRRADDLRRHDSAWLKAVAKPADPETIQLISDAGDVLELCPAKGKGRQGQHVVRFVGKKPPGTVTMYVAGQP